MLRIVVAQECDTSANSGKNATQCSVLNRTLNGASQQKLNRITNDDNIKINFTNYIDNANNRTNNERDCREGLG